MFIEQTAPAVVADRIFSKLNVQGLNAFSTGSTVRTVVDAFLDERIDILRDIRFITSNAFLRAAEAGYLDLLGEDMFGMSRLEATAPNVSAEDQNVLITTTSGVLSDYLPFDNGIGYKVPIGTTISDATGEIQFQVTEDTYLEDDFATSVFVAVDGLETGTVYNVAAGVLTTISIEGLNVTNLGAIANGQDEESDNNYRYRISQAHLASERGNETAIRLAALSVSGVSDVVINTSIYGPGVVYMLVIPEGNTVSPSTVDRVRGRVLAAAPAGSKIIVEGPRYVSVYIEYQFGGVQLTETQQITIQNRLKSRVGALLSNAEVATDINPALVLPAIFEEFPGVTGRVYKLCIDGIPQQNKRYTLKDDELAIFDITVAAPVRAYF